jgi:hypothetical protein
MVVTTSDTKLSCFRGSVTNNKGVLDLIIGFIDTFLYNRS